MVPTLIRNQNPIANMDQFRGLQPVMLGYDETGAEFWQDPNTGAIKKKPPMQAQVAPRPPAPQQVQRHAGLGPAAEIQVTTQGESRNGLTLASALTAGNAGIQAFATQLTTQHSFLCVGFRVNWNWVNDPAAVNDTRVGLFGSVPPTINGIPRKDGLITLNPGESWLEIFARPEQIIQSTTLGPGTWSLDGGTAPMSYRISVTYLTALDLALIMKGAK